MSLKMVVTIVVNIHDNITYSLLTENIKRLKTLIVFPMLIKSFRSNEPAIVASTNMLNNYLSLTFSLTTRY